MKKLYIIYYHNGQEYDYDYIWSRNDLDAREEWKANTEHPIDCKIDVYEISDAIQKQDLINHIERYIIKPLKK